MLNELSQAQKGKVHVFLSYVGDRHNTNISNFIAYAKGRSLMGEEGLRKWLMYFLYKNEYRILKPVAITIKRRLR
jgi:hypothetical protein